MTTTHAHPPFLSDWLQQLAHYPGVFVTGTDTGIGKTWVGTRIVQALCENGVPVVPRKPVESGWSGDIRETDTYKLADAAGLDATQAAIIDQVCPNHFAAPLSPPRAAQLEGQSLDVKTLAQQCRQGISSDDFLYVEGAGGVYSPIADDGLNADLAEQLALPVVLVTEDRVGCINHVLLAVEAIQHRKLSLEGVVLNPKTQQPEHMDNRQDLQHLLTLPVIRLNADLPQ